MATTEDSSGEHSKGLLPAESDVVGVSAVLDDSPGATTECTLYPTDVDEDDLVTTWITASEGSFVGLDEKR